MAGSIHSDRSYQEPDTNKSALTQIRVNKPHLYFVYSIIYSITYYSFFNYADGHFATLTNWHGMCNFNMVVSVGLAGTPFSTTKTRSSRGLAPLCNPLFSTPSHLPPHWYPTSLLLMRMLTMEPVRGKSVTDQGKTRITLIWYKF